MKDDRTPPSANRQVIVRTAGAVAAPPGGAARGSTREPGPCPMDRFNSEVWQRGHPPQVLGWTGDQLAPVVACLAPFLPADVTVQMQHAVAACARSLVVEYLLGARAVRYSRAKNHYGGVPKRYRRRGRYYSCHFVTGAVDLLDRAGLIGGEAGVWSPTGQGCQSVVWPEEKLVDLLRPVVDVREPRGDLGEAEVIVLRDRDDKRDVDYQDTVETVAMRAEMRILNDALARHQLYRNGKPFPIPLTRRVFTGSFDMGGRCYCQGVSFQNIPAEERLYLQVLIDGVLHSKVEIDYCNLHAVMAYSEAGLSMPCGDQYAIDGFDRAVIKRAFNVLLNATARHKAVAALSEDLHSKDDDLWRLSGLTTRLRKETHSFAETVVAAVEKKHHPIEDFFGSDCGAKFQLRDSNMAVQVMLRMIESTGRCPLPVHDSFLVPEIDQEALAFTMHEVASEEGLPLSLKASNGLSR